MARWWRWLVVLVAVGMLLATPPVLGLLPGRAAAIPAAELLARIGRSAGTPYSGYASATGGLSVPVTGELDSVTRLLGGRTLLRVWWRSASDWRVASRDTQGLRLRPDDRRTTIGHVDVWADARSAVPLRVDVLALGAAVPAMTSQFTDFSTDRPARSVTAFAPPASARVRDRAVPDLVAFISRFGGVVPPVTLVGLPRNDRLRPY